MSSQLGPLQPTSISTLNTPPPLTSAASPSNRHYPSYPSHPSPTRDGYASQHNPNSSPAPSSRRPSHRPSASANDNSPMSSRTALASPVPISVGSVPSDQNTSTSDRKRNMATAVPPRTSSSHHHSNGASASRRATQSGERAAASPRRGHGESRDMNGSIDASAFDDAAAQGSRSRRAHQAAQAGQDPSQRSSSARESSRTGGASYSSARSPPATSNSSRGPSREASEILNSILISQPEEDIERERERLAMAQPHHIHDDDIHDDDMDDAAPPPVVAPVDHGEEARRGGRSRHDHSKREKHTKFGEYILGNTIGEGEFGKVKLGWKQEGGVQVAIKLIKRDAVGSNPTRMAKIMREVGILKQLTHPNIVRLHKMETSDKHFGIILEYASGGELFDYILNHRYLKDNSARRLFAQLVSGVGYLHKKGIVHRDLKLENLLLDRNRNIIITDFGFANTFDPDDELTELEELNLTDREFVKARGLDAIKPGGSRKGDLMQTSCGSPCYAAPELVVSDSLYTGRKVDVWSCGVILYAMLAGYLPFDDDPANPEGDNINLLYKYIVNTPLTFPEYVSPHARDLLRRILVPNPRKRADLFEVARHSWLSEYAHVVEFITSSTTTEGEIQNTTVPAEDDGEPQGVQRSSSVRESSKKSAPPPALGGLISKQGTVDADADFLKQQKDNKRRTVQVEYVPPNTTTQRGDSSGGKTRARSGSQGAVEVGYAGSTSSPKDKPLPKDPPVSKDAYGKSITSKQRPPSAHRNTGSTPTRPGRDARAVSDAVYMTSAAAAGTRPATGGSLSGSRAAAASGRASYGLPVPPEVADTNAHGRIQQPSRSNSKPYGVPPSSSQDQQSVDYSRPSTSIPPKFAKVSGFSRDGEGSRNSVASGDFKGHKRSSTMSEIGGKLFGRSGSLFGKNRKRAEQPPAGEKKNRYPPVSMNNAMVGADEPRVSMDSKRSRRSFSIGLGKKRSGSIAGSQASQEKQHNRRFSFVPGAFSLKAIGIGRDDKGRPDSQQDLPIQDPPAMDQYGRYVDQNVGREQVDANTLDGMYAQLHTSQHGSTESYPAQQRQHANEQQYGRPSTVDRYASGAVLNTSDGSSGEMRRPPGSAPYAQPQDSGRVSSNGKPARGVLQKNKRLGDAWDSDSNSRTHDHSGSSGPARRVMDFFRRRGKARGGEN